jgi:hypothetical protein
MEVFANNKYTRVYEQIVERAKNRISVEGYTEKHHIVPKPLGGSNRKDNLVVLTAREHFICHRLLVKMTSGEARMKMSFAIRRMIVPGNEHQQRYKVNGRTYEILMRQAKDAMKILMTENNPMFDPTIRHNYDIAIKKRGRTPGMTGKSHSEETRKKMREATLGQVVTDDTKEKLRTVGFEMIENGTSTFCKDKNPNYTLVSCVSCRKTVNIAIFGRNHKKHCRWSMLCK